MYRILFFLLCTGVVFAGEQTSLLSLQFEGVTVDSALKEKVPFLRQDSSTAHPKSHKNRSLLTLTFTPDESTYKTFARVTGTSIFNSYFTVSWYVFTDKSCIPSSTKDMLRLVNVQKPEYFEAMYYLNGKWQTKAELPVFLEDSSVFIYAYVSYPNAQGVLVPIASQSFYYDLMSRQSSEKKYVRLNTDILFYWKDSGYF